MRFSLVCGRTSRVFFSGIGGCILATVLLAADPPAKPNPAAQRGDPSSDTGAIAATVGGKPIFVRQVDQLEAAAAHGRTLSEGSAERVKAAVLLELVDRQLVEEYLEKNHWGATPEEIDAELAHLKSELEHAKKTLPEFLARSHQSEAMLRAELGWRLSWQKYLKQQVTDETLEAYFNAHHREFDGTELRVSHILLRPTVAGDDSAVASLVKEAEQIRKQIESGEITFEAAAEKYSAGPSRHRGGDLGFIPRHGQMVEPFARTAFALEKGQISQPVATVFGIHLIRVTDVKPGDKKWTDVRDAVRTALAEHLFGQLVARERGTVDVRFTGKAPYFKPGTTEVVVPK
ncbi:MAG TPA: peptidylprolyl isomerase [Pirellulales bacterium]|jgi:parvulin-like peptidyl-prolyl isomerase|nr:peptidylprolyl isomerase [Pirellulales bacterium]